MLMPGPTGFQHNQTWTLNPSYMPVFLFERLARSTHQARGSRSRSAFRAA
jgi:endo-1,4-beta-D-glucanase Y